MFSRKRINSRTVINNAIKKNHFFTTIFFPPSKGLLSGKLLRKDLGRRWWVMAGADSNDDT
jgi:hypothetical protein